MPKRTFEKNSETSIKRIRKDPPDLPDGYPVDEWLKDEEENFYDDEKKIFVSEYQFKEYLRTNINSVLDFESYGNIFSFIKNKKDRDDLIEKITKIINYLDFLCEEHNEESDGESDGEYAAEYGVVDIKEILQGLIEKLNLCLDPNELEFDSIGDF